MNGLYIHIPFCIRKCNYCDFASYPALFSKADEYIDALCSEMKQYKGEKINTMYFGGGTPTMLSHAQISRVINCVHSVFDVSHDSEITIEANPCTIDAPKASALKSMGFTRVSLGAQSFVDSELKLLGRLHKSEDTTKAYTHLRNAGFNNISLDLMYAIHDQNMASLSTSLDQMLKLCPEHISCYGLKIEDGTKFDAMLANGEIGQKDDDEYADMYDFISDTLTKNGYIQYELSNFSKEGFESKHNIKYWTLKDYIGIGLSASSLYKNKRFTHTADFDKYVQGFENAEFFELSSNDLQSEYMFLSLRLTGRGANKKEFEHLFGNSIEEVFPSEISKHLKSGLIIDKGDCYVLHPKAYYISNSILCDFV